MTNFTFKDASGNTQTAGAASVGGALYTQVQIVDSTSSNTAAITPDGALKIVGSLVTGASGPSSVSGVGVFNVNPVGNGSVIALIQSSVMTVPSPGSVSGVGVFNTNHVGNGSILARMSGAWTTSVVGTIGVSSVMTFPGTVSTANSSTATLSGGAAFTGTAEDVKDFGSITISVFADQASATDGLSIQQSSNGTNWDFTDTYTIAASTGKTFSVQPSARFMRIVYTNGATPQGAFRLQTVYHPITTKASSQRTSDAYTNETDLEQEWAFNSFYNGSTWDRVRGNTATGMLVNPGGSSIVGSYVEDSAHTTGNVGLFTLRVRNDTMSSITSADGDYSPQAAGPIGETVTANSPINRWWQAQTSVMYGTSVQALAPQGSSVFTYISGVQIANNSGTFSLVKITGGLGSVLGWTVAPANGGSNITFINPIKTGENSGVSTSISGVSSIYVTMQGFTAKI